MFRILLAAVLLFAAPLAVSAQEAPKAAAPAPAKATPGIDDEGPVQVKVIDSIPILRGQVFITMIFLMLLALILVQLFLLRSSVDKLVEAASKMGPK
jgi:hypothetical protein